MLATVSSTSYLEAALDALSQGGDGWHRVLSGLPVPIYVTDADGKIAYWNRACIRFAGRVPQLGQDRWCVTWRIFSTTGDPVPHDQCPMAVAIRERRAVRGEVAIAERPDGSRAAFTPYPTPLFDAAGNLTGAVNMLIDVTDGQADALADQARRCRRLASAVDDREAARVLATMADAYERTAATLTA